MKRNWLKKCCYSVTCVAVGMGVLVFILTRVALQYPHLVENWYSRGLYPLVVAALTAFSNLVSFSLDDLFYAGLITYLIINTILLLMRRLRFLSFVKRHLVTVAIVYSAFYVLWGFNYYRSQLNERLELQAAEPDVTELMQVFEWLINEVNESYTPIYTIDRPEVLRLIRKEYEAHADFLRVEVEALEFKPKPISLSRFFAAATISGYYGPFFGETHVNSYMLPLGVPVVMAHEIAHQLGVTSEAEANFYAWYICSHSPDKRLAYSANLHLLRYFIYTCHRYEGYRELAKKIRYEVRHDFYKSHRHWMALMNNKVELVATKVNDAYLKTNSVTAGIDDYDGVVKYVMDYKTSQ
ncbi:DUF3810 domain-containing protein [Carboxylicivirga taeanensis]|uniref:DUF3810 domain-containing protein n=1 Tax=Carboxylicivirga taeanensis TaxID=1416875 RepID=UPI003F6DD383